MFKLNDKNIKLCECGCNNPVTNLKNTYLHGHYIRVNPKIKEVVKSKIYREKMSKATSGSKNGNYKGIGKMACYNTYSDRLLICEKVRRDFSNTNLMNVKCVYCGKWFTPTRVQVVNRIYALDSVDHGEQRLYCCKECKNLCPIYRQYKYPSDFKTRSTEVDPQLRQMVFERDNWECQKCNNKESLECHHIDPIAKEPMFANDIDSCITLCTDCHKEIHMNIEECRYAKLRTC